MNINFNEFCETEYRSLIRLARNRWEFIKFPEYNKTGRICLWRHDIDASIHRAARLARIEAEERVTSTYFVQFHSYFYNPLESDVARLLLDIQGMGHELALHFDVGFYKKLSSSRSLVDLLTQEKQLLETFFGKEVRAFSFHDPEAQDVLDSNQDEIAGMVNTYGQSLKERFAYISDSNCYWRFRNLRTVLEAGNDERLHILTHPECWTADPMSPRDRIARCIEGRAAHSAASYDNSLLADGRLNVRTTEDD